MSLLGIIPFIIAIVSFIFAFKHFAKFVGGVWRKTFHKKHLVKFVIATSLFLIMFYIMAQYHNVLGIKSSCARNADCSQENS
jgi:uncharacterized membrane protein YidH (DUF202 family)